MMQSMSSWNHSRWFLHLAITYLFWMVVGVRAQMTEEHMHAESVDWNSSRTIVGVVMLAISVPIFIAVLVLIYRRRHTYPIAGRGAPFLLALNGLSMFISTVGLCLFIVYPHGLPCAMHTVVCFLCAPYVMIWLVRGWLLVFRLEIMAFLSESAWRQTKVTLIKQRMQERAEANANHERRISSAQSFTGTDDMEDSDMPALPSLDPSTVDGFWFIQNRRFTGWRWIVLGVAAMLPAMMLVLTLTAHFDKDVDFVNDWRAARGLGPDTLKSHWTPEAFVDSPRCFVYSISLLMYFVCMGIGLPFGTFSGYRVYLSSKRMQIRSQDQAEFARAMALPQPASTTTTAIGLTAGDAFSSPSGAGKNLLKRQGSSNLRSTVPTPAAFVSTELDELSSVKIEMGMTVIIGGSCALVGLLLTGVAADYVNLPFILAFWILLVFTGIMPLWRSFSVAKRQREMFKKARSENSNGGKGGKFIANIPHHRHLYKLQHVLTNSFCYPLLLKFLQKEYSSENALFYLEVKEFERFCRPLEAALPGWRSSLDEEEGADATTANGALMSQSGAPANGAAVGIGGNTGSVTRQLTAVGTGVGMTVGVGRKIPPSPQKLLLTAPPSPMPHGSAAAVGDGSMLNVQIVGQGFGMSNSAPFSMFSAGGNGNGVAAITVPPSPSMTTTAGTIRGGGVNTGTSSPLVIRRLGHGGTNQVTTIPTLNNSSPINSRNNTPIKQQQQHNAIMIQRVGGASSQQQSPSPSPSSIVCASPTIIGTPYRSGLLQSRRLDFAGGSNGAISSSSPSSSTLPVCSSSNFLSSVPTTSSTTGSGPSALLKRISPQIHPTSVSPPNIITTQQHGQLTTKTSITPESAWCEIHTPTTPMPMPVPAVIQIPLHASAVPFTTTTPPPPASSVLFIMQEKSQSGNGNVHGQLQRHGSSGIVVGTGITASSTNKQQHRTQPSMFIQQPGTPMKSNGSTNSANNTPMKVHVSAASTATKAAAPMNLRTMHEMASKARKWALKLHTDYLQSNAVFQVNIDSDLAKMVKAQVRQLEDEWHPTPMHEISGESDLDNAVLLCSPPPPPPFPLSSLYRQTALSVFMLMETDSFRRFLLTDDFQTLLQRADDQEMERIQKESTAASNTHLVVAQADAMAASVGVNVAASEFKLANLDIQLPLPGSMPMEVRNCSDDMVLQAMISSVGSRGSAAARGSVIAPPTNGGGGGGSVN